MSPNANATPQPRHQPTARAAKALQKLVDELRLTDDYVDGISIRVCKKKIIDCTADDFLKLIAALTYHKARRAKEAASTDEERPF